MKQVYCLLAAALSLCLSLPGIQAQVHELTLEYERFSDADSFRPRGHGWLELMAEPPEGEWVLPEPVSIFPVYAWVRIGAQERLLMLDQSSKDVAFYDRAYFDADANGNLTDDPVLDTQDVQVFEQRYFMSLFPATDIQALVDGTAMPYSFTLRVEYHSDEPLSWGQWLLGFFTQRRPATPEINIDRLYAYLSPHCMYTAELALDDAAYRIYLADSNVNGRFDDWGGVAPEQSRDDDIHPSGDRLYLTAEGTTPDYYDAMVLGRHLSMNDRLYALDIAQTDRRLTLTDVTDTAATIELPMPAHNIVLVKDNDACLMALNPGTSVLAPPGRYRLLRYLAFRDEPEGARWRLAASGTWNSPEITAAPDEPVVYPLGEPFQPTVRVPAWARDNLRAGRDSVRLSLVIRGAGNETVWALSCIENRENSAIALSHRDSLPKEATYRILLPDGEVVTQGSFEYG